MFATPVRAPGARYFKSQTPYPVLKPAGSTKTVRKPVIVIDPGHGGSDPGAIGIKGTYEKTITTKAADELAARLRRSGRYTVILTRTNDRYVDHDDRLRIARTGQADLFISIHADSAGRSAKGATVYTLADRAKGRQKRIVNNQNWILDVDLSAQSDPVGDILVDLAQRKTKSQSDAFAEILLDELTGKVDLIGNSHRRAGYYVLLAPDVPAVLLELGYLSNKEDEKRLKTKKYRDKITSGVERAIDTYMAQR
ncbi:MAG: N-acetylmuramoyl-L-alanine amidase [Litorimonas sp.]